MGKHDRLNNMLLASVGVDPEKGTQYVDERYAGWEIYAFKKDNAPKLPVLLVKGGPKDVTDAKRIATGSGCILIFRTGMRKSDGRYRLFLKSSGDNTVYALDNEAAYRHAVEVVRNHELGEAKSPFVTLARLNTIIHDIHEDTGIFINRGVFSTHYLNNRLFDELTHRKIKTEADVVASKINGTVWEILDALGWKSLKSDTDAYRTSDGNVSILVVKDGTNLDILQKGNTVSPSYRAIAELENSDWVMLTNKRLWRLYTRKVSASTTSYFQVEVEKKDRSVLEYFVAIFGALTYEKRKGRPADIDLIFNESIDHAIGLGKDLTDRIIARDGVFLSLVKGILDYDSNTKFSLDELDSAREAALKTMYRIWFILYAESRDQLPVKDKRYRRISLEYLRTQLDSIEADQADGYSCWQYLLNLFEKIRNGDPKKNLPQYNGDLFGTDQNIDGIDARNRFIVRALRGLFEKDGEYVDYTDLGVRRLGDVYEQLLELQVRQTDKKIALLKNGTVVDVSAKLTKNQHRGAYFYEENDLYLSLEGGIVGRKLSASYYTPEGIVEFLVRRGLEPIFKERESKIKEDLERCQKDPSSESRQICVNNFLDIQVLDPAMGSGHFLIEALNQITRWATRMLKKYPEHPILQDIKSDRMKVISELENNDVKIDKDRLTPSAMLKRKILKRCIFGVDLNRLAVELARLSLWLDSFVAGMPLTYMSHHIKLGDSTIGVWKKDLKDPKNQSLDDWIVNPETEGRTIYHVSHSPDITMKQVNQSKKMHQKYEDSMNPHKSVFNVLAASKMDNSIMVGTAPPPPQLE